MSKILPCEAARLMNKSNLFVYEAMKRGVIDIGTAMLYPGRQKWDFWISPTKLAAELGIDVPTLNERLKELREV